MPHLGRREGNEHVVDVEARALDLAVEAELELAVGDVGDVGGEFGLARQVEVREHSLDQAARLLVVEGSVVVAAPKERVTEGDQRDRGGRSPAGVVTGSRPHLPRGSQRLSVP